MNVAFQRNVGSFLRAAAAFGASASLVAGSGADGAPVNGLTIDRNQFVPLALSAFVVLQMDVTGLGEDESVEWAITAEDSANGTDWDALDIGPPDGVGATVVTEEGVAVVTRKAQLGAARRYVRFLATPTFSATGTDAATIIGGTVIVAGFDELPADPYVEPAPSS